MMMSRSVRDDLWLRMWWFWVGKLNRDGEGSPFFVLGASVQRRRTCGRHARLNRAIADEHARDWGWRPCGIEFSAGLGWQRLDRSCHRRRLLTISLVP